MQTLKFPTPYVTGLNKCPYLYFRDEKTESPRDKILESYMVWLPWLPLSTLPLFFVWLMRNTKWWKDGGHQQDTQRSRILKVFSLSLTGECASSQKYAGVSLPYWFASAKTKLNLSLPSPPLLLSLSILLSLFPYITGKYWFYIKINLEQWLKT